MIKRLFVAMAMMFSLSIVPLGVSASTPVSQFAACGTGLTNFFGFQPWHACLDHNSDGSPKLTKITDIYKIIIPVVESIVKLAALVAIGYILYMLIKIASARGDSGKYAAAMGGIRDAVIGLVIAMLSVAILNFVASAF